MTIPEITRLFKYFTEYTQSRFGTLYSHNSGNEFHIVIQDDGAVYQLNSDHEPQGIELRTLEDLRVRYTSFIGESLETLDY